MATPENLSSGRLADRSGLSALARRRGLIVNISFWVAHKHIRNVAYGVSKAATDKMTIDMATELKPYGVACVSLYRDWSGQRRSWKRHNTST